MLREGLSLVLRDKIMITVVQHGKFKKLNSRFQKLLEVVDLSWLDKYGKKGVEALAEASPVCTGLLRSSWYYKIEHEKNGEAKLIWCNDDIEGGKNIAIIVQMGHGTKNGTYIPGIDYINPAIRPIIEQISEEVRREVKRG